MKKSTKKKVVGGVAVATLGTGAAIGVATEMGAGAVMVGVGAVAGAATMAVAGAAVVAGGAAVYGLFKGVKWLFSK